MQAATPAPVTASGDDDTPVEPVADRWAGTMTHDWNEAGPAGAVEPAALPKAKAKPRISVEAAVKRIPPEALQYLHDHFKTDIHRIRSYNPESTAKQ